MNITRGLQPQELMALQGFTDPHTVRIGRRSFPFTTYAEVSAAYRAVIESLDLGASETPICAVFDADGVKVANVAYNGRIFATLADGESDYERVLHETRSPDFQKKYPGLSWRKDVM